MRMISVLVACIAAGLVASCDSSSPASSGDAPKAGDTTGLVGRWVATYRSGQIKAANHTLVFYANGSYLDRQDPPPTEKSFFFRDSGTWVAIQDTLRMASASSEASYDGGVTWIDEPYDPTSLPYRVTGDQLILIGKDLDDGSDVYYYFTRQP